MLQKDIWRCRRPIQRTSCAWPGVQMQWNDCRDREDRHFLPNWQRTQPSLNSDSSAEPEFKLCWVLCLSCKWGPSLPESCNSLAKLLPTQNMIDHRTVGERSFQNDHVHRMIIHRSCSNRSYGYWKRSHAIDRRTFVSKRSVKNVTMPTASRI